MRRLLYVLLLSTLPFQFSLSQVKNVKEKAPVDYVNPYIGNISHLLVPTYPTVHLPNSMLRVYPERDNFTSNTIEGLPLIVTSHRGSSAFGLSPFQGELSEARSAISYGYDNEVIKPYYYSVDLDDDYEMNVQFAPSHQSGIYKIDFNHSDEPAYLIFKTGDGELSTDGKAIRGFQNLGNKTRVYIYLESEQVPVKIGTHKGTAIDASVKTTQGGNAYYMMEYPKGTKSVSVRYGVSFISSEQAEKNLRREIKNYDLNAVAQTGRAIWNETLGKIKVTGGTDAQKAVFYTSLYRTYERMICISEDGRYFSAYDGKVHEDTTPFYVDDWIWDTFRATHPLRMIIEEKKESDMINSFLRMAYQMPSHWMPTFPEVNGDSRRMNCNHGVATVLDAYTKGMRSFDLEKAYEVCKAGITEKTLSPWSSKKAGALDQFYKDNGYFPALATGEKETVPEVHSWEKRQPIAVSLGTVYDEWCLGNIAQALGNKEDADYFLKRSLNYHKVFNKETRFFHPKDAKGNFVEPFDYRFSGGLGGREAYDENNGWVYRWDVQHNVGDLVEMMGGKKQFVAELERMYNESLGRSRYDFYSLFPDHTGNVGQFSMGNEPSMHVPYLYNYAGEPWRTQKRIRNLLTQWFRNDLMGIPGDEDGGGLTSFVVFSMMGFYPMTPGLPMYVIGSPMFERQLIQLGNGKTFEVVCQNYSPDNKYIQSAKLNGKVWNKSWFSHEDMMKGGRLEFVMGKRPNKAWASDDSALPPSFSMPVSR